MKEQEFHLDEKVLERGRQIDGYRGQEPPADFIPVYVVQQGQKAEVTVAHNQTKVHELLSKSPYDYRPKAWWYVPRADALKQGPEELSNALEF